MNRAAIGWAIWSRGFLQVYFLVRIRASVTEEAAAFVIAVMVWFPAVAPHSRDPGFGIVPLHPADGREGPEGVQQVLAEMIAGPPRQSITGRQWKNGSGPPASK